MAEVGRQHSWYHGSKPDIFRFSFFFFFFCPANDRLRPLYGLVVRVRVMEFRFEFRIDGLRTSERNE